ncbi:MAG: myxosortase-dependent metalloprotease, MXAN_2677/MXAN_2678 family [Myxococcales bacterium]|nr:myxosortase-dependent metalloprotease, MXAN_2677/MXAN_2678 family [Myxococcales bacterium]
MIHALVATVVLSQAYARSRQSETDLKSQCLWWKENTALTFRVNTAGNDETPGDSEFRAIAASFATWQNELAACSSLSLTEGTPSPNRQAEYLQNGDVPNENLVLFRQRSCKNLVPAGDSCASDGSCGNKYDCWQFTEGAIAITTTSFSPRNGQIFDSDIELNTPSYIFTTVDSPPCVRGMENVGCIATDIQNTMTHEVGHLLGLAHINEATSTMNPRAVTGELVKRVLDPGSKKFVCDVYPRGGVAKTCFIPRLSIEQAPAAKQGCFEVPGASLLALGAWLRRRRRR